MNATNPFAEPNYGTPHNTVPFDRIRLEDYESAMREGMKQEEDAIRNIIAETGELTFENVILPETDQLLSRATTVFFNLTSAHTNDEMDALAQKMTPLLTAHSNRITLNEELFEKIKYVYEHRDGLDSEQKRLTEKVYNGFERNGANLKGKDKEEFARITTELSSLTLDFSQKLLKELNAFKLHVTTQEQLEGLPQRQLEAAQLAAKEEGLEGWLFTLHAPSYIPFITYADNRELRKQMYMARNTLCHKDNEFDNRKNVARIVELRTKKAQLLGYETYAQYALSQRMAQDTQHVYDLLDTLSDACLPTAQKQVKEVEELARKTEGENFVLQPWDFAYYSHKLKVERFDVDEEKLRPYFPLAQVQEGIFSLAHRLYGISFKENSHIPVFHPDVKAYEVTDSDGTFLAILYTDFFPRASKQGGAWMTSYQEQYIEKDGTDVRPHVSLTANFTPPTAEKPSLLSLDEVETFLHEFGHCLHGIFSKVRYRSLSGTNVRWDFVELPSQIMENFATEPQFLHTFARHYETGEPIPENLIDRIVQSRKFQAAYNCIRQVSFGLLDMGFYTQQEAITEPIEDFEQKMMQSTQLLPHPSGCCMAVQFSHIMSGGYAAGYYSYKWAEVLDADAFAVFRQAGIFDKDTAEKFRGCILSKGDTEPPMELYRRFRGKEPQVDALLERTGVTQEK